MKVKDKFDFRRPVNLTFRQMSHFLTFAFVFAVTLINLDMKNSYCENQMDATFFQ